ncbi:C40 family peptidase [Dactylosporangium roseum]|uniref:C40 family peptidase n=1 Tax=Dactylosporangium roseum TaxID=47989 RepID=A0ABY5Z9U1_9ACTN|nr:C40 family peptidase [Dactylosporangium roseum]UWZ38434.1 C40 family peptidase [Dactylosporangium roseum]
MRRNLAAATTVCTIACAAAVAGTLDSPSAAGVVVTRTPYVFVGAAQEPARADRLVELRPVERRLHPAPPAAQVPDRAPGPQRKVTERTAAPRTGGAGKSTVRRKATRSKPRGAAPANRLRVRTTTARPVQPAGGGDGTVVGFAMAQVGKGYTFGSAGPDRFDCSGLVVAAYRRIGVSLPRTTGGLAGRGRPVGRGELRPGDLVFPSSGHVGIYIGGGRIVHASTERGGVKVSPIYDFRYARRIIN